MNSTLVQTWTEWFISYLKRIPFQLMYMRELVENPIAAVDTTAIKITSGKDQSPLPYRVDPADDADLLYATLVIFASEVAEKHGGAAPHELRNGTWHGKHEPQGLRTCTPTQAFNQAANITKWLTKRADWIANEPTLDDSPDDLVRIIKTMSARYPRTPRFKAYRPHPCPTCGQHTLYPHWKKSQLTSINCDHCGQTWPLEKEP